MFLGTTVKFVTWLCVTLCCVALLSFGVRGFNHQRAISAKDRYLVSLRQRLNLPSDIDPVSFIAQQLQQQTSKKIAPEELDKYVPLYDRAEVLYQSDGHLYAKTYYFLPRNVDKYFLFGFWLSVRYSKDGSVKAVVVED